MPATLSDDEVKVLGAMVDKVGWRDLVIHLYGIAERRWGAKGPTLELDGFICDKLSELHRSIRRRSDQSNPEASQ